MSEGEAGIRRVSLDPPNTVESINTGQYTSKVMTVVHRQRQPDGERSLPSITLHDYRVDSYGSNSFIMKLSSRRIYSITMQNAFW